MTPNKGKQSIVVDRSPPTPAEVLNDESKKTKTGIANSTKMWLTMALYTLLNYDAYYVIWTTILGLSFCLSIHYSVVAYLIGTTYWVHYKCVYIYTVRTIRVKTCVCILIAFLVRLFYANMSQHLNDAYTGVLWAGGLALQINLLSLLLLWCKIMCTI